MKYKILIIAVVSFFYGCGGTTRIRVSDPSESSNYFNKEYDIYVDDRLVGTSQAKVSSMGFPHTATVEARDGDQVVGTTTMRREIKFTTLILMPITYFTSLFWMQYYPDDVTIPVFNFATKSKRSWDDSLDKSPSRWTLPLTSAPSASAKPVAPSDPPPVVELTAPVDSTPVVAPVADSSILTDSILTNPPQATADSIVFEIPKAAVTDSIHTEP